MKPKQPLTHIRATIVAKNPFMGTIVSHISYGSGAEPRKVEEDITAMLNSMKLDYIKYNWEEWFKHKKLAGWGIRKCFNKIEKYFELSEHDVEILKTHAARAGLIKIDLK